MVDGMPFSGEPLANKFNEQFLKTGASGSSISYDLHAISHITSKVEATVFMSLTIETKVNNLIHSLNNCSASATDDLKPEPVTFN